jgi:hypothetical protein
MFKVMGFILRRCIKMAKIIVRHEMFNVRRGSFRTSVQSDSSLYWEEGGEKIKFPKKLRSGLRKGKGKKSSWDVTGIGGEPAPTSAPT